MNLASSAAPLAVIGQLSENSRLGVATRNPVPHPGQWLANSRTPLGLPISCSKTAYAPAVPANNRQRFECAIKTAQGGSIAGVIGQSDNPIVSALLGNSVADGAELALNAYDAFTADSFGDRLKAGWNAAVNVFADHQVDAAKSAVLSTYSYRNKAITKAVLGGPAKGWSSATNLLKVGAKIAGYGKLAGDALVFLSAYGYSCSAYGD